MSLDTLTEVRRRLDVTTTNVSDAILGHWINWATEVMDGQVPSYNRGAFGYQEGVIQLAIKLADTSSRGTISVDPAGEFVAPSPSATAGMVRAVRGTFAHLVEPNFA